MRQGLSKIQGDGERRLDVVRKHFLAARSELQQIQKSAALSGNVKPPGFDPGITQYFLANAPPRVVEVQYYFARCSLFSPQLLVEDIFRWLLENLCPAQDIPLSDFCMVWATLC